MDFSIEESANGNTNKKDKQSNLSQIIIIIIISLVAGISVFFISYMILNRNKKPEEPKPIELALTDQNVKILYQYVSYGNNNKFVKGVNTTKDSFSNDEVLYYALQFLSTEDLTDTKTKDAENRNIYYIQTEKIQEYINRFFGSKIEYKLNNKTTSVLPFLVDNKNMVELEYDAMSRGYKVVFTGLENNLNNQLVMPFYKKLVKATQETDNSIKLEEKVIYTDVSENNGTYTIAVYKDFNKQELLEVRNNMKKEDIQNNPIKIDSFLDNASTITYQFKVENDQYYFDNSVIS